MDPILRWLLGFWRNEPSLLRVESGGACSEDLSQCISSNCIRCAFWGPGGIAAYYLKRMNALSLSARLAHRPYDGMILGSVEKVLEMAVDNCLFVHEHGPAPTCLLVPLPIIVEDVRPFWEPMPEAAGMLGELWRALLKLATDVRDIEEEYRSLADGAFHAKGELVEGGDGMGAWRSFALYNQGVPTTSAAVAPRTIAALERVPRLMKSVFGHAYFSIMEKGVAIREHTGPVNFRMRVHIPLFNPPAGCTITVGGETRSWRKGEPLMFDDSFPHSVTFRQCQSEEEIPARVVLLFDVFHPHLTDNQVLFLADCFAP
mmetsp:Transcript_23815/g.66717  ORF Transcript_23815/g.66717 Transcript_23815/m.66717 type:complete len:316 (+) Transcript_23815:86-1033(+)